MKKKIVALGLVVALSVSSLTGCSFNSKTPVIGKIVGLGSSEMFKIDKEVCSKQEYMLVLMDTAGTYKADFGGKVDWNAKVSDNQTLQSYVMQKVKEDITVQYTLASMAKERNISLSTDESSMIKTKAVEYYKSLTSQEKEYTGASQENVESLYKNYYLADKVYDALAAEADAKISDEEARVMKIQYIRMNTDNTKEDKIKSTLKTVTDLVKGGYQTFAREAKQYSEDNVFEKTLKKNEATKTYEKSAFNLSNSEISSIIQDGKDYYLVYCVNSYLKTETEKNKEEIIKNAQQTYFNDKYSKYLKDIDVDFNDDQAKKIKLSTDENVKAVNLMTVYNTISKELNKK